MAIPWDELAPGVFRRRYESLDLNVGLVLAGETCLVIDTRASHRQADVMRSEIRAVTTLPVGWLVNTHWHWDHTFGNARFPDAESWGHEACAARLRTDGETARSDAAEAVGDAHRAEIEEVVITPPTHTFSRDVTLDVGDVSVRLRHLGRGHTDGDIVVEVGDVVFAGDLLEQGAPPYFGDGYPFEWPATVAELATSAFEHFVPGHGDVMTRADVETQLEELNFVRDWCRLQMAAGRGIDDADYGSGVYPVATMRDAYRRVIEAQTGERGSR